jgi:glycosyltransferase involved in cell wall biosynthesis
MKILHVIHSVNPQGGGPIEGIRQLGPASARLGITTEVMSLDAPDAPGVSDFPLPLHTTGPSRFGYGYNPRIVPWLRENRHKYDAVIVNGMWQYAGFATWCALHGTSTPYYVYLHGMLDPWFKRYYPLKHLKKWLYWPWAEYRVLRDARAALFTCEEEKLEARKSFWLYRCREVVTGYGITSPPGDSSQQRNLFLQKYPELKGKRIILFLGRVHVKKGCDLLLRAWAKAASQMGPDFHLVIAGPTDNAFGMEMEALARKLGLSSSVTWTGMIRDDLKWGSLRTADAFILPSHQENFGVSVVEALACGVPVLISDKVNIWREINADAAGIVETDDLEGTTRLLDRWNRLSSLQKDAMRILARTCFEKRFDIARTAEALSRLLKP